jgi:hypothetical protein
MRHVRGLTLLCWLGIAATLGSCLACRAKGGSYVGKWECTSGGGDFFEIKANNDAFLVTDESNKTYPATVDDKGTLILSGVPMMGSLPLPIDSSSSELICSVCKCNRYAKKSENGQVAVKRSAIDDREAQKRTVSDIRNIGTAMFSWLTDQVGASAAGQSQTESAIKTVDLRQYSPISHKELQKILIPQYLQAIPETDGWGQPYEFYLNATTPLAKQVMSIRSSGRDGRFSSTDYMVGGFYSANFDEDIVWSDGFFVRWPSRNQ